LENVIKDFGQELRSKDKSLEISFDGYQFLENQLKEEIADLKKKIEESKAELEEKDNIIENLEERVTIEQEQVKHVIESGEK